jgi:hypothetical protein
MSLQTHCICLMSDFDLTPGNGRCLQDDLEVSEVQLLSHNTLSSISSQNAVKYEQCPVSIPWPVIKNEIQVSCL